MALRRKDKKVRKLNRTTFRRPAGRTAEFFDLRGTEENTGTDTGANTGSNTGTNYSTNRRSGYSDTSSSGPSLPDSRGGFSSFSRFSGSSGDRDDSSRPYRERHRVEVNTQNTRDGYFYPAQEKTDRDMYGGRDSYGGGQRIVHGNVPGNRSGQEKPADQKEISSDLIYGGGVSRSWRSAGNSAGGSDTGSRTASYSRSSRNTGSRSSSYGRSSSDTGSRSSSYSRSSSDTGSRSSYGRSSGDTAGRSASYNRSGGLGDNNAGFGRGGSSSPRGGSFYSRKSYEDDYEDKLRAEYPEDEEYEALFDAADVSDDYDEEEDERREARRQRLRRREMAKRQREQQLRGYYIKMGIGAAVLLLLIIFVVPRIARTVRSPQKEDSAAQGEQSAAAAREDEDAQGADEKDDVNEDVTLAAENDSDPGEAPEVTVENTETADDTAQPDSPASEENSVTGQAETGQADDSVQTAQTAQAAQTETATEQKDDPSKTEESAAGNQEQAADSGSTSQTGTETDTGQTETGQTEAGQTEAAGQTETGTEETVSGVNKHGLKTAAESGLYARQDDWRFILVNPWYILPEGYEEVTTSSLPNGESVDSRCFAELVSMLDACRAAGGEPVVCSSYRPLSKQVGLYENQVKKLITSGMSREEAEIEAGKTVAVPGTSEHELGLAVDLCDFDNQNLDDTQAETKTQKWLMEHSWEYGFILRYPETKSDITGIIFEPWHYRYVGREAAEEITKKGICLEEYLRQ